MEIDQYSDYNKDRSLDNTIKSIRKEEKNSYDHMIIWNQCKFTFFSYIILS